MARDNRQLTDADWKFRQNASQFARQGYSIAGSIRSGLLERSDDGDLTVGEIVGSVCCIDKSVANRAGFVVKVAASVSLTCQSCGDAFQLPISSQSSIHVAHDAAELASWEDEAFECIEGNEKTSALELVEDELLLAVPFIPRCEKCEAKVPPHTIEFN